MSTDPTELQSLTPQELVAHVREKYAMSWDELGEAMSRSGRMMRKIARGETSGASYKQALLELSERGQVTHLTPRRRAANGKLVTVRAKRGADTKTITPDDAAARMTPSPKRGRFHVEEDQDIPPGHEDYSTNEAPIYFPEGGRMASVEMPKTRGKGRAAGMKALMGKLRSAAKSQRGHDKRVRLRVEYDFGGERRGFEIGHKSGYTVSDILADVRKLHAGSVEDWVNSQLSDAYRDIVDGGGGKMVKANVTVFNAQRSKEERREKDAAGTRRWNRDAAGNRIVERQRDSGLRRGRWRST